MARSVRSRLFGSRDQPYVSGRSTAAASVSGAAATTDDFRPAAAFHRAVTDRCSLGSDNLVVQVCSGGELACFREAPSGVSRLGESHHVS